jgi:hypothetical protein
MAGAAGVSSITLLCHVLSHMLSHAESKHGMFGMVTAMVVEESAVRYP